MFKSFCLKVYVCHGLLACRLLHTRLHKQRAPSQFTPPPPREQCLGGRCRGGGALAGLRSRRTQRAGAPPLFPSTCASRGRDGENTPLLPPRGSGDMGLPGRAFAAARAQPHRATGGCQLAESVDTRQPAPHNNKKKRRHVPVPPRNTSQRPGAQLCQPLPPHLVCLFAQSLPTLLEIAHCRRDT